MADPRMFVLEIELGDDLFYLLSRDGTEVFSPELAVADLLREVASSIEITGIQARYINHIRTGQPIGSYGYKVEEVTQ